MKQAKQTDLKLLESLICPETKTTLIYDSKKNELISKAAGVVFPIRDGIPVLVLAESRPIQS